MKQWLDEWWEMAIGFPLAAVGFTYMTYIWGWVGLLYAALYSAFIFMLIVWFGHLFPWPDHIRRRYWGDDDLTR